MAEARAAARIMDGTGAGPMMAMATQAPRKAESSSPSEREARAKLLLRWWRRIGDLNPGGP